jgi:DNA-binding NarL/FixJ family response regulator
MCPVINTLLVDDSVTARKVFPRLLKNQKNIHIVGTAGNGQEALEQVAALRPDLVLMDLYMPEFDGLEAIGIIRNRFPDVRVIAMSMDDREETLQAVKASGAHGFIWKLYLERNIQSEIDRLFHPRG